tara:strand:- start:37 stop:762 length:726 start_codon:yes stop_codon:yes gene_type:complete
MKNKLSFLLIQARESNDPMIKNELECFKRILNSRFKKIQTIDITRDIITSRFIEKFDIILVGGSGNYSIAKGGFFMEQTLSVMQFLHEKSKPTFASCWGFQAMAKAMGGDVITDLKLAELGTIKLKLTKEGKKDPVFKYLSHNFFCQMGHEDIVIKQPKKSTILASSEKIKIEAFCFKNKPIYCTQFHPELRVQDLRFRMQTYPRYINKILGITTEKFLETKCFEAKESENLLNQFINTYF